MPDAKTSRTVRPWPRWVGIAGWSLLGILGTTLAVFLATVTFGAVHGTEFCPQTFERRSYSFYELPIVHVQMTGERHEDLTGDTEKCVTSNKLITPIVGKKDWHVIVGSRGTRQRRPGDAGILLQYLDAEESSNVYRWTRWSEQNMELAKALWPAVQRLALRDMYLFVPELFEIAKLSEGPAKLQEDVDGFVAGKLLVLGRQLQARKNAAEAVKVLDEALLLAPEIEEIKKASEEAREAVKAEPGSAEKPAEEAPGSVAGK